MDHTRNSEPGEAYEDLKELLDGKNYYFVTINPKHAIIPKEIAAKSIDI